ncbi:hypothetical protein [Antarctobacter sp.]|uniref:hypothetical protein n=1 Tax=Antarctobacter sp. TaxID=1872577 RepID=UPI002B276AE9|nr:hypothetical protein [Antarctobacter sp.]
MTERTKAFPLPTRRKLYRAEAAAYVGVTVDTLDCMIADDLMPRMIRIYYRTLRDVRVLESATNALPGKDCGDKVNDWDEVL